jgi:hypothetical protein
VPPYGHPFTAIAGAMIVTEERRAHPQRPVLDGEGAGNDA